jgi:hypothetical protein
MKTDSPEPDDAQSGGQRTVDWIASMSDEELAEHNRQLAEPITEETHPSTGYRSAAFARWRRGIHQQMAADESKTRPIQDRLAAS